MHGRLAAATTPQWSRPVAWPTSGDCPWPRLEVTLVTPVEPSIACHKSDGHCQGHIQVHLLVSSVTVTLLTLMAQPKMSNVRSVLSFNGRTIAGFQCAYSSYVVHNVCNCEILRWRLKAIIIIITIIISFIISGQHKG